jgi:hypothetical protein
VTVTTSSMITLCSSARRNREPRAEALDAAVEEVANRLTTFLEGNQHVGARDKLAFAEALSTVRGAQLCNNPLPCPNGIRVIPSVRGDARRCGLSDLRDLHSR